MALTLPTFTLNDPTTETRLMAAFDQDPNLTAAQEYKRWLKGAIIAEVQRREAAMVQINAANEITTKNQETTTLLDNAT
jgi:hypothetical protein